MAKLEHLDVTTAFRRCNLVLDRLSEDERKRVLAMLSLQHGAQTALEWTPKVPA